MKGPYWALRRGSVGRSLGHACDKVMARAIVLAVLLGLAYLGMNAVNGVEERKKKRQVQFRAEQMTGKDNVWTLSGSVVFAEKEEEITLKADRAIFWPKEDRAEITGNIEITDPEHSATAEVVRADFGGKIIFLEGNVVVVRTPKEAAGNGEETTENGEEEFNVEEAKKKRTTITCDRMEYDYDANFLAADGNVKVVQEKRTVTCQKAEYDEEREILTLVEDVRVEDEEGNWFECSRAIIDVENDTVEAFDVTGRYFYEEE